MVWASSTTASGRGGMLRTNHRTGRAPIGRWSRWCVPASDRDGRAYGSLMEAGRVRLDSRVLFGALGLSVMMVGAACSPSEQPSPSASAPPLIFSTAAPSTALVPSPGPSAVVVPTTTPAPVPTQIPLERPLAAKGSIAVVRADGTLWMVDVGGRMTPFADAAQGNYGFPVWSPDRDEARLDPHERDRGSDRGLRPGGGWWCGHPTAGAEGDLPERDRRPVLPLVVARWHAGVLPRQ